MKKIQINLEEFLVYYNQNMNDRQIAEIYHCTAGTIYNFRKTNNLPTKFTWKTSIDYDTLKKYSDLGYNDTQIQNITGVSDTHCYQLRKRWNITRLSQKENQSIILTSEQEQILVGHILGDGHLRKDNINCSGKIIQSLAQEEYAKWKYLKLKSLCTDFNYWTQKDKRNNNTYYSCGAWIKSNPELNKFYEMSYKNKKKFISYELLNYFTPLSLAVLFMDDGYKSTRGYNIATNCFTINDISLLRQKLKEWNLETTIQGNNRLYIKAESKETFNNLVSKFIIPSMRYKLHKSEVS